MTTTTTAHTRDEAVAALTRMGYIFAPESCEFSNGSERGRLSNRPDPRDPCNPQSGIDWALQRPDADHTLIPVVF